jgi:hypothetical protein
MISRCPHLSFLTSAPISHTQRQEPRTEPALSYTIHSGSGGNTSTPPQFLHACLIFNTRFAPFFLLFVNAIRKSGVKKIMVLFWAPCLRRLVRLGLLWILFICNIFAPYEIGSNVSLYGFRLVASIPSLLNSRTLGKCFFFSSFSSYYARLWSLSRFFICVQIATK